MKTIKLKNVSNTNYIFTDIGDPKRGKRVGCAPGQNILVTNEEEIVQSALLQQLIASKKLVPLEVPQNTNIQSPSYFEEEVNIKDEDINVVAGTEDDARELQQYLNSQERQEAMKARDVVTQQPYSHNEPAQKPKAERGPDPKGANGLDLFYEQPKSDIMVDEYQRPPSRLYDDYSEKKN